MSGKAATYAAEYAAKKMLGKEMDKYKNKKPAGSDVGGAFHFDSADTNRTHTGSIF